VDASGLVTSGSAGGVFGLRALSLSSTASDAAQGSVVPSPGKSVHPRAGCGETDGPQGIVYR